MGESGKAWGEFGKAWGKFGKLGVNLVKLGVNLVKLGVKGRFSSSYTHIKYLRIPDRNRTCNLLTATSETLSKYSPPNEEYIQIQPSK